MSLHEVKCPVVLGFTDAPQLVITNMWNALYGKSADGCVADYGSFRDEPISNALTSSDQDVQSAARCTFDEFSMSLINPFVRKIFTRGLFVAADDSQAQCLGASVDGVNVNTLNFAGRLLTTIARGQSDDAGYRQITFATIPEEPARINIISFRGHRDELLGLIETASVLFKNSQEGFAAMQPDQVYFAGVPIGEARKPTPPSVG